MKQMFIGIFTLCLSCSFLGQTRLKTNTSTIAFVSDAPLELIKAESVECSGILDLESGEFAFRVNMKSFQGFNSALQREHFMENYIEVDEFANSTFQGRILNPEILKSNGKYNTRAKGQLLIHGEKDERIIEVDLDISEGSVKFSSEFDVELSVHNIAIPQIVYHKIAEVIHVTVSGTLE